MKSLLLVVALLAFSGCAGSTKYGKCIGFFDHEKPGLEYKLSKQNAIVTALASSSLVVPLFWATFYAKCPYRAKAVK